MNSYDSKIQALLNEIRPALQQDGGDLEYVSFIEGTVAIRFQGACVGCPFSQLTLKMGIEEHLKQHMTEIKEVTLV